MADQSESLVPEQVWFDNGGHQFSQKPLKDSNGWTLLAGDSLIRSKYGIETTI